MAIDLIITVDTEEEGLWSGSFRSRGNTVANCYEIPRFQELCNRFDIRPTYFVDWPVVDDDAATAVLADIQRADRCEIGAHLHPWCTPPLSGDADSFHSYMCNLAEEVQRAKLQCLTDRIAARFGRPTSFRAGRYGLDILGARILADLGYEVDSSVVPFRSYAAEGGPDFRDAPHIPYFVGNEDLCSVATSGRIIEVPVSTGFNRRDFKRAQRFWACLTRPALRRLRLAGICARLGIARPIKLSPEQATVADMTRLIDIYRHERAPCVVLMFHSSSLLPGQTPYVPDAAAREAFLEKLGLVFDYCCRLGMQSRTLTEFSQHYRSHLVAAAE